MNPLRITAISCLFLACVPALLAQSHFPAPPEVPTTTPGPLDQYQPSGYVNDFAAMIDADSKTKLESFCKKLNDEKKVQIAIVTIFSLEGMTLEQFATRLFNRWGVGNHETHKGLMILLSRDDHKYRIEVGRALESTISNELAASAGKEMVPFLRTGNFGGALLHLASRLDRELGHPVSDSRAPAVTQATPTDAATSIRAPFRAASNHSAPMLN